MMNPDAITLMIVDQHGREHYIALPQTLRRAEIFKGDVSIPHGEPKAKLVLPEKLIFATAQEEKKIINTPLKPLTNLDPLTSLEPQQQLPQDQQS